MVDGSVGGSSRPEKQLEKIRQKSRRIGCVFPLCNLQHSITQPIFYFFDISVHFFQASYLLVERGVVQLDVVAPHAPETGEDLREGGHDEVLAVPATNRNGEH